MKESEIHEGENIWMWEKNIVNEYNNIEMIVWNQLKT